MANQVEVFYLENGTKSEVKNLINRNNVDKWSFSLIPVEALIDKERGCCFGHISSKILNQYKFDPKNPRLF